MQLMTKAVLKAFEEQGYTGDKEMKDIQVICKFFNPVGPQTWYLYEYDPEERIFMCFANLGDPTFAELGSLSLDEIESVSLPYGMKIERDRHFPKMSLKDVYDKVKGGEHV